MKNKIQLSETWAKRWPNMNNVDVYEMYFMNRTKENGGGVAIYVDKDDKSQFVIK